MLEGTKAVKLGDRMGIDQNKAVVRGLYEGINARDWSAFGTLLAPNYLHLSSPEYRVDREGLRSATRDIGLKAFPDLQAHLDEVIAEGDKVMVRWTQRGTHLGPFLEYPPTGRSVTYSGINIFRVLDGQIVEDTPY
jgi:steroid delta-isomerase-like uncharacterized protein